LVVKWKAFYRVGNPWKYSLLYSLSAIQSFNTEVFFFLFYLVCSNEIFRNKYFGLCFRFCNRMCLCSVDPNEFVWRLYIYTYSTITSFNLNDKIWDNLFFFWLVTCLDISHLLKVDQYPFPCLQFSNCCRGLYSGKEFYVHVHGSRWYCSINGVSSYIFHPVLLSVCHSMLLRTRNSWGAYLFNAVSPFIFAQHWYVGSNWSFQRVVWQELFIYTRCIKFYNWSLFFYC